MKIGKQIFLATLRISLAVLVITAGAGFFQLARVRSEIINVHNVQSDLLVEKNLEVLTSFNQDIVTALARVYSESLENKLAPIVNRLLLVRNYLESSYDRGIETISRYDESDLNLRLGVSFEDVEEEFRIIQSARDLMSYILQDDDTALIYFVSESGMMIESETVCYGGADFRYRYWYVGAVEKDGIYWSSVYADILTGEFMITASIPVYGASGSLMGVVGYDIRLAHLVDEILNVPIDIIAFAFLRDSDGAFLIGSVPDRGLGDFVTDGDVRYDLQRAMFELTEGVGLFTYEEVIAGFALIPTTGWRVGVLVDYQRISEPITRIDGAVDAFGEHFTEHLERAMRLAVLTGVIIAAVVVLLSVLISRKVTRSITKPIDILTVGVGKVSAGDLEYQIEVSSGNELETLADSFNYMTANLREHIENMLAMRTENERIATELNVATQIQADMLPSIFPPFPDRTEFEVYAAMHPAKEVGGDFYDFFLIDDDHLALTIADVSGKGVPAALFMVIAKTLLKNNAQSGKSPKEVFESVNNILCENNEAGMFVTAFMGYLHIPSGRFTCVNAGHNPPLLKKAGGAYEFLKAKPAFILAGMENVTYKQEEIILGTGDTLYLYTDGVTEAMNEANDLYGEDRLLTVLNSIQNMTPNLLLPHMKSDIDQFAGSTPQSDDITMLALLIK